ncbi:unnamed protein product [Clonostachys chloroleuca]|uniref:Xylanolytic transcriptional activator regulatory domain-containing protein n=1 Tax=Clonostachys chloroleuca TaxID=1926264 RepID=A0AA35MEX6_9HYPO|nr:unnamed protein product [Clonostachys chloroleuca]CAI6041651.1 unnamed protein product [Clonostachys chloroleuca]CAI6095903.1 unnamed protein product [Clonostachys chloroleuca]
MATRIADLDNRLNQVVHARGLDGQSPSAGTNKAQSAPELTVVVPSSIGTALAARSVDTGTSTPSSVDILVQKGSTSHYFNDIVLSRVLNENEHVQTALTSPQASAPTQSVSPYNVLGILSVPDLSRPPHTYHPPSHIASQLWVSYLNNLEIFAGQKLLHIPTDEVKVFQTIRDPSLAALEDLALCFAIYFGACLSVRDPDQYAILGGSRTEALLSFKTGLEQALAHANLLDRPSFTGCQALAIYLSALRIRNRSKGLWVANGLAIRLARTLGLHCDGERLGLSPFQSELRRRLWWHLLGLESRAGEDYGFQSGSEGYRPGSVGIPLNIEDIDLVPDMKDLPPAREGWTGMTHFLIHIHLTIATSKLTALATSHSPSEDERVQVMDEVKKTIEGYIQCCNPVIPRQRLALLVSTLVVRKIDFLSRIQWQLLQSADFDGPFGSSENLREAEDILEASHAMANDEIMARHLAPNKAYPQYSIALYILWYFCTHPAEFDHQRAWELVNRVLEDERVSAAEGFGAKLTVLEALAAKCKIVWESRQRSNEPSLTHNGQAPTVTQDESTRRSPYGNGTNGDSQFMLPTQILDSASGPMQYLEWMSLVSGYPNADLHEDGYWGLSDH